MSNTWFLQDLMATIAEQGRSLLPRALFGGDSNDGLQKLIQALMSVRGEASGVAIAHQLVRHYRLLEPAGRRAFFRYVAATLKPDEAAVKAAAGAYQTAPGEATMAALQAAVESPRQEFFRRLNMSPGATAEIVRMRADLLALPDNEAARDPALAALDGDMHHLLQSWFNRGFLVLRRIDWQTPAAILEKIIAYEAVHEIAGWDDLRRRLDPADRRCFAFFHPSLVDEPLIFVEVALQDEVPGTIRSVLDEPAKAEAEISPTTAVFYSISNCQEGLRGISFGNFLIKQVVEELARERPSLKTFVTLSPVPRFATWLARVANSAADADEPVRDLATRATRAAPGWHARAATVATLKPDLMALAAHYFLLAKSADGRPIDPVARFHLGNGARLERINWLGDVSEKGLAEAHGLMVNYRYEPREIEKNHEAYANDGTIAASRGVRALLRANARARTRTPTAGAVPDGPSPAAAEALRLAPPAPAQAAATHRPGLPDSVQPDSVQPDSVQPDSVQPDSVQPDSVQPDSVRSRRP